MDVLACRLCLSTHSKLHCIEECGLNLECLGLDTSMLAYNFPAYVCYLCLYQWRKFVRFRSKCKMAEALLESIFREKDEVTIKDIIPIQCHFTPLLSYSKLYPWYTIDNQETSFASQNQSDFACKEIQTDVLEQDIEFENCEYFENDVEDSENHQKDSRVALDRQTDRQQIDYSEEKQDFNDSDNDRNTDISLKSEHISEEEYLSVEFLDDNIENDVDIFEQKPITNAKPKSKRQKRTKTLKSTKDDSDTDISLKSEHISEQEDSLFLEGSDERIQNSENNVDIVKPKRKTKAKPEKQLKSKTRHSKKTNNIITKVTATNRRKKKMQDFYNFAKKIDMEIKFYTKEEQEREMANRKEMESYKIARFRCEKCHKGYISETAFKNHQNTHNPSRGAFMCELCDMYFQKNGHRMIHIEEHAVKYTCKQCKQSFTNKSRASDHFKFHSGVKYQCQACLKVCSKRTTYFNHIRNHHATMSCDLCGEAFVGTFGLQGHMKIGHREASKCPSCGRMFLNEEICKQHLKKGCRLGLKACVRCGEGFENEELLATHLSVNHKNTKSFACELCSKTFTEHNLSVHWMNTHSGKQRPDTTKKKCDSYQTNNSYESYQTYICEHCGKSCKGKYRFVIHMRVHTGERPHKCPQCPKTFKQAGTLRSHVLMHTDERPYKCSECPRAFRQSIHRKQHMRTHTLEKPYSCSVCQKRFTVRTSLKEHVQTIHEGLPRPRRRRKH